MEDMLIDGLDLYMVLRREMSHQVVEMGGDYFHDESFDSRVLYVGTLYPARRVASEVAVREDLDYVSDDYYRYVSEDEHSRIQVEVIQVEVGALLDLPVGSHEVAYCLD